MNKVGRRIINPALAVLLAGLISFGFAGVGQSGLGNMDGSDGGNGRMGAEGAGGGIHHPNPGHPLGLPVDLLFSGHGLALRGDESHALRLKVEVLLPVPPERIRNLVASNRSLEEIREQIRENAGDELHRGSLAFEGSHYAAINILILPAADNSTLLKADLADPESLQVADRSAILGRINLSISPSPGGTIGQGELEIDRPPHEGRYAVLLSMDPPGGESRRSRSQAAGQ
ncbi:MAG TPA: hypothetical protein PLY52_04450 [Methanothrix sp.]|jgi:hypothetical protein|uniref:hypothetical protein n=1 Tax=Methanothrix sp. TaxID=90426 RepID=UPI002BE5CB21|nr:hypothetical protein [Methanothrix sp.]MDI9418207.1 hypothetical protein [Euryarchaeota archaeon]HON35547.1 hypothetical protein [Methanothrix sp.]HRU76504.1 hypothetical protein [Methanothrix sp.]